MTHIITRAQRARKERHRQRVARKERPHIKFVAGSWYAFPGRGSKQSVNLLLVTAINFCKRLNRARREDV